MLLPGKVDAGIAAGTIDLAFRSWLRPTVKTGGTLVTRVGLLAIDDVSVIDPADITDADARRAGAADADDVRSSLRRGDGRQTYRIAFHLAGDDPRIALRAATDLTDTEWADLERKLTRMDERSDGEPWTRHYLELIEARPAVVSTELAATTPLPRPEFKNRVRRLKSLGLTESLDVGYRLSPRGEALLARMRAHESQRP